jgi:hypothetical protein
VPLLDAALLAHAHAQEWAPVALHLQAAMAPVQAGRAPVQLHSTRVAALAAPAIRL